MTAQIPDVVHYEGEEWTLASFSGPELFDPSPFGFRFAPMLSCCWRGFLCGYRIAEGCLTLEQFKVVANQGPLPELLGKAPTLSTEPHPMFQATYADLGHPIDYSGTLLLTRDFVRELYVHMGLHPAWKYRHVVEVELHQGRVITIVDRSSQMAEMRERLAKGPLEPGMESTREEIGKWIESAFSRKS